MKRLKNISLVIVAAALVLSACAGLNPAASNTTSSTASQTTVSINKGSLIASISATGNVRSAQNAILTWQASGKVGQVNVVVGQKVNANDIMAALDPTTLPQSLLQAKVSVINAQKNLDALLHPTELQIAQAKSALEQAQQNLNDLMNPSPTALAQAEANLLTAQSNVTEAQRVVTALGYDRGTESAITKAKADYLVAQQTVDSLQTRYDNQPGDPATDPGKAQALANLTAAIANRDKALMYLNWYSSPPTAEEIATKKSDLALAQAKLEDAQKAVDALKNPGAVDIALAKAKVADAQKNLDTLTKGPAADDLTIAQTNLTTAEANLNAAFVMAPFTSTVTDVQVSQGDQVTTGKTAFRVDDMSKMFVDLSVNEIDYPQVKVGQAVTITLDALPDKAYAGQVYKVGTVGTTTQSVVNFTITVLLTNIDDSVKPGMTAAAYIQVANVNDVLIVPSQSIQTNNGRKYVYLVDATGAQQQVQVQTGISSDVSTQIISDNLREGDQILLTPPAARGFNVRTGVGGGNVQSAGGGQP